MRNEKGELESYGYIKGSKPTVAYYRTKPEDQKYGALQCRDIHKNVPGIASDALSLDTNASIAKLGGRRPFLMPHELDSELLRRLTAAALQHLPGCVTLAGPTIGA